MKKNSICFFIAAVFMALPVFSCGKSAQTLSMFYDSNNDRVPVPCGFYVSKKEGERTVKSGLVLIGPDLSEFVWVPMSEKDFDNDDFSASGFYDETDSKSFKAMKMSVLKYGGFYMGRYEASKKGSDIPQSKKCLKDDIWVHIPPQEMIVVCNNLYSENKSVTVFLPWGITWDRTLQWLVETGCKTKSEVASDSSSWGNYNPSSFESTDYSGSGEYEQTKANNIYDLAGNFWEWTQERCYGTSYAARSGGYGVMGGPCSGSRSPAAFRSGLPGNDHHPNIGFRIAMYVN